MQPVLKDIYDFPATYQNLDSNKGIITKDDCVARSKYVKNVSYDLTIAVTKWAYYFGTNLIKFDLTEVPTLLNIDFAGEEIANI